MHKDKVNINQLIYSIFSSSFMKAKADRNSMVKLYQTNKLIIQVS